MKHKYLGITENQGTIRQILVVRTKDYTLEQLKYGTKSEDNMISAICYFRLGVRLNNLNHLTKAREHLDKTPNSKIKKLINEEIVLTANELMGHGRDSNSN